MSIICIIGRKKMLDKICEEYKVDKLKMHRLVYKIINAEKKNLNTKTLNNVEMVEFIVEKIKEEVNKCF